MSRAKALELLTTSPAEICDQLHDALFGEEGQPLPSDDWNDVWTIQDKGLQAVADAGSLVRLQQADDGKLRFRAYFEAEQGLGQALIYEFHRGLATGVMMEQIRQVLIRGLSDISEQLREDETDEVHGLPAMVKAINDVRAEIATAAQPADPKEAA